MIVRSLPGTSVAATMKKAAEEGSPGTVTSQGFNSASPWMAMTVSPFSTPTSRLAPKPASIRSVWSRVGTGSITRVMPGVLRPASSTALFTCALATGRR